MKILCSPGNVKNAKSYPYWEELYKVLEKDHEIIKLEGILPIEEIKKMVECSDIVITIDSFLPHLIKYYQIDKKVIVLWGKSDPEIFGYPENTNLLKDRKYLRPDQFVWWFGVGVDNSAFVLPSAILEHI